MPKFQKTFRDSKLGRLLARAPAREIAIILVFVVITAIMTWPWVLHLRDTVSDPGDPYLNAWIMWWDYFQTFHDPVNLFQSPLFFPYSYTLAYSEHNFGLAMLFFPFFALGLRPLTAAGLATLLGFVISGYGAFRLARTLTGSSGVAWVAGVVFGFALYRFATLSHLNYLFAGWIPLTLEALVLFVRRPSKRRAVWLGIAFTMNALTAIHWFVLTLMPFTLSGAALLTRHNQWRNRKLWLRLATALIISGLILLPFLLPYQRVVKLQGTIRSEPETMSYSARPIDWLAAPPISRVWRGFGPVPDTGERHLFPGLMPILLAFAAFLLVRRKRAGSETEPVPDSTRQISGPPGVNTRAKWKNLIIALDAIAIVSIIVAIVVYGYGGIKPFGLKPLHVPNTGRPLAVFAIAFLVRLCLAYPRAFNFARHQNLVETIRGTSEAISLGLMWVILGFFGSLGLHFFFHQILFEYVFIFRSIRVPARWAMIAMLGVSLLAGLGAQKIAQALHARTSRIHPAAVYAIICCLLLGEVWVAPMALWRGEVDPDPVTLYLEKTPMRGGVAHLPSGTPGSNQRYVLRQADHRRPLITAFSGFVTPTLREYEKLSQQRPIPDQFLDLLEQVPASYLVVHDSSLPPNHRPATREMLARATMSGRLRFIQSFPGSGLNGNDGAQVFAVTKTEPGAKSEAALPEYLQPRELGPEVREDPTLLLSEFDTWGFPLYLLYRASYARLPRYQELLNDAQTTGHGVTLFRLGWQQQLNSNLQAFTESWTQSSEFKKAFASKTPLEYVDQVYSNLGITPEAGERNTLVGGLQAGTETRASVLSKVIAKAAPGRQERITAQVLFHYFGYLHRNPDDPPDNGWDGFKFWRAEFEKSGDETVTRAFMLSGEYQGIKKK